MQLLLNLIFPISYFSCTVKFGDHSLVLVSVIELDTCQSETSLLNRCKHQGDLLGRGILQLYKKTSNSWSGKVCADFRGNIIELFRALTWIMLIYIHITILLRKLRIKQENQSYSSNPELPNTSSTALGKYFLSIYVDKYFGLIINKIKSVFLSLVNLSLAADIMEQKYTIA